MNRRHRRLVALCGLVPTFIAMIFCFSRPPSFAGLEWRIYDTIVRQAGTRPPGGRVVIVDIDERSLTEIGQWPWRRDLVGHLIGSIRDLGAAVVALDIVFAESDRHGGGGVDPDAALEHTLRQGRVALGYALIFDDNSRMPRDCVHHPLSLAIVQSGVESADHPFFRATSAVCNLPGLAQAAAVSGFLNAAPDPDGILRRVPLVVELDGRLYPSLALAAVSAATGTKGVALRAATVNSTTLTVSGRSDSDAPLSGAIGEMDVPLDGKSNLLVQYRGEKGTFPYVSALDVLNGDIDSGTFRDKVVFVGTSALGTREVVSTPLDTLFTGVEVQASVADNLLQRDFVHRPDYAVLVEALTVVALGVLMTWCAVRFGFVWGAAAVAASLLMAWTGAVWLLGRNGVYLSPLFPTLGLPAAFGFITGAQALLERVRADRAGRDKATTERVMVQALLSLVEIRDAETGRHSRRIQEYTRVLAQELTNHPDFRDYLTPERIDLLSALAPLHDIGKVGVPDRLLNKPGLLTADELLEMRRHPEYGREVILRTEREVGVRDDLTLSIAKDIVYTHHEKWDGSGYPQGLRGTQIPIPGRLIALVDVYDAVHSRRVYHEPVRHEQVVALIVKGRGTHFDPSVVDAFVRVSPVLQRLSEHPAAAAGPLEPAATAL